MLEPSNNRYLASTCRPNGLLWIRLHQFPSKEAFHRSNFAIFLSHILLRSRVASLPFFFSGARVDVVHQLLVLWDSIIIGAALLVRPVSLARVLVGIGHILRQRGVGFRNRPSCIGSLACGQGMRPDIALSANEFGSVHLHPALPMRLFMIDYQLIVPVGLSSRVRRDLVLEFVAPAGDRERCGSGWSEILYDAGVGFIRDNRIRGARHVDPKGFGLYA